MKTAVLPPPPRITNRLSFTLSVVSPASDGCACPPPPPRAPWAPAGGGACWTAARVADNTPTRTSDPRTSIRFMWDSKCRVRECYHHPPHKPGTSKGLRDGTCADVELVRGRGPVRGRRGVARTTGDVAAAGRAGSGPDAGDAGTSGAAPPTAVSVRPDADHRPADSTR